MWNYQQCRRLATLAVAANVMLDDVVTDFVHAGAAIELSTPPIPPLFLMSCVWLSSDHHKYFATATASCEKIRSLNPPQRANHWRAKAVCAPYAPD